MHGFGRQALKALPSIICRMTLQAIQIPCTLLCTALQKYNTTKYCCKGRGLEGISHHGLLPYTDLIPLWFYTIVLIMSQVLRVDPTSGHSVSAKLRTNMGAVYQYDFVIGGTLHFQTSYQNWGGLEHTATTWGGGGGTASITHPYSVFYINIFTFRPIFLNPGHALLASFTYISSKEREVQVSCSTNCCQDSFATYNMVKEKEQNIEMLTNVLLVVLANSSCLLCTYK